jgi:starvation-inducible outer membrane lipoprotein
LGQNATQTGNGSYEIKLGGKAIQVKVQKGSGKIEIDGQEYSSVADY